MQTAGLCWATCKWLQILTHSSPSRPAPSLRRPLCVQIVEILDLMKPESYAKFDDVYVVNELMNTDLHQIIYSSQPLTDEHGQSTDQAVTVWATLMAALHSRRAHMIISPPRSLL